ncbi:MAG: Stk1 family PASTA domain-containing Ser/Thr kinase [Solirubrobacteraceae bacterium]
MNRTGQTIDGRYRVVRRLGTGGMADVFDCEDLQLGRHVALKLMHEQLSRDETVVARFRRESHSAAGLQHPHVVQVFDRGDWDGIPYMAMELVDGVTLKDVIRDQAPLDPIRTIDQISQVLDALRYAHKRGLVHRDIKPQNVLVASDGTLKVADFGIARAVDDLQMTQTGMIVGTAHYLSPEQASGQPITPGADLYAVGVVLFEMLTGRMPFDGEQPVAIALKHVNEPPPALSVVNADVPADLERVVLCALEKRPDDRFADADEFLNALQVVRHRIATGAPVPDGPPVRSAPVGDDLVQQTGGWLGPAAGMAVPAGVDREELAEEAAARRRRRRAWIITGALALVVAVALVGYLLFGRMETVPAVTGKPVAQATAQLEERGFKVRIEARSSSQVRADRVISQDPRARSRVRHGREVTLVVSSGVARIQVPNVIGRPEREAKQVLARAGFTNVKVISQASDTVAAGTVSAVSPQAGAQTASDEPVTLTVSIGPDGGDERTVKVPAVEGRTEAEARRALEALGLRVKVSREESDDEEPGTVLDQSPASGQDVPERSEVGLVVAREPQRTTTTTTTTTDDVQVPNVEGRPRAEAERALTRAGLEVRVSLVPVTEDDEDGVVVRQTPNGGRASPGDRVELQVGELQPAPPTTTQEQSPGASAAPKTENAAVHGAQERGTTRARRTGDDR